MNILNKLIVLLIVMAAIQVQGQLPGRPAQGQVKVDSLKSEVLQVYRKYSVYLPKSFTTEPDRKYPVLYLLHGVYDNHNGWVQRGHLQDVANKLTDAGEAEEMVIIVPDAGSVWNGYFKMGDWDYEKFFFSEFIPQIEQRYRILGDKEHRAIAGLSMGGGGTTVYAQKHPDYFSSAYAMSALMGLEPGGGIPPTDKKFELLNQSVIDNHCVKFIVNADQVTRDKLKTVRWFVDCGDDDFLFDVNLDFYREMRKAGIPCQLRVRDGGHDWEYWHSALYTALPFVSRGFKK